jgi:hypothetical protein
MGESVCGPFVSHHPFVFFSFFSFRDQSKTRNIVLMLFVEFPVVLVLWQFGNVGYFKLTLNESQKHMETQCTCV